jgi:tRNA (guanosine-2'-O-)-methyltransferase
MKRVTGDGRDVFRPKGRLAREIELAERAPFEVTRILRARLSDERARVIDETVAHRTLNIAVAIEGVRDPHNTAVIRTADAFGIQVVHIIERGTMFLSSRKVTQGAHKWVDFGIWSNAAPFIEAVRKEGKKILVATADSGTSLSEINPSVPMALVFGNEHEGVSREMSDLSDGGFCIPMFGFSKSLNVSAAAAVTLAAMRREGRGDLTPRQADVLRARFHLRAVRAGYDIVMHEIKSAAHDKEKKSSGFPA